MSSRLRLLLALGAAAAVVLPVGWFWQQSLLPSAYSVMDMGYPDGGSGPALAPHADHHAGQRGGATGATSVTELTEQTAGPPDVRMTLVARAQPITVAGHRFDGYTLNGSTPGPSIEATQGDLVAVTLRNANIADGTTLHWHGLDVPNAVDGVAGVTQDAVMPGESHTYRFVADQVGTYWFHSHQVSHEQVLGGLLGSIVITPKAGIAQDLDVTALAHTYRGNRTLNGRSADQRVAAKPGQRVRVRVINTDNGTLAAWTSTPFRVLAVDGHDLDRPSVVTDRRLAIPAGGRADLEVIVGRTAPARVQIGATTALIIGAGQHTAKPTRPHRTVDLLSYGRPSAEPVAKPTRTFDYVIGRRPGFLDGKPGFWWTVNGHLFPDVPMFTVRDGEDVRFRIRNDSGEGHPMHLHGHHARLLAIDGRTAQGSAIWLDSIDVEPDQSVDIQFRADNPGIWMDHCHNLPHATEGLVAHLMYQGVTTPYRMGDRNRPE